MMKTTTLTQGVVDKTQNEDEEAVSVLLNMKRQALVRKMAATKHPPKKAHKRGPLHGKVLLPRLVDHVLSRLTFAQGFPLHYWIKKWVKTRARSHPHRSQLLKHFVEDAIDGVEDLLSNVCSQRRLETICGTLPTRTPVKHNGQDLILRKIRVHGHVSLAVLHETTRPKHAQQSKLIDFVATTETLVLAVQTLRHGNRPRPVASNIACETWYQLDEEKVALTFQFLDDLEQGRLES